MGSFCEYSAASICLHGDLSTSEDLEQKGTTHAILLNQYAIRGVTRPRPYLLTDMATVVPDGILVPPEGFWSTTMPVGEPVT